MHSSIGRGKKEIKPARCKQVKRRDIREAVSVETQMEGQSQAQTFPQPPLPEMGWCAVAGRRQN